MSAATACATAAAELFPGGHICSLALPPRVAAGGDAIAASAASIVELAKLFGGYDVVVDASDGTGGDECVVEACRVARTRLVWGTPTACARGLAAYDTDRDNVCGALLALEVIRLAGIEEVGEARCGGDGSQD